MMDAIFSPDGFDATGAGPLYLQLQRRIADAVAAASLDAIQLHGKEDPARAAALRARFGKPVWKVISVAGPGDVAKAAAYTGVADFILFDAKTPKGTLPGGMGLVFDWSLLAGLRHTPVQRMHLPPPVAQLACHLAANAAGGAQNQNLVALCHESAPCVAVDVAVAVLMGASVERGPSKRNY